MNDLEATLPQALEHLANGAPHRPDLAASARRGVRRRRIRIGGPIAAAAAVLVVLGSVWVAHGDGPGPASSAPSACRPLLITPIPVWARAGFTGRSNPPFAYSASGDLIAIVFADPLTAPPAVGSNNKILWVSEHPATTEFTITGQLEGSDETVTIPQVTVGPSIVDVPAPGCWHLALHYGGHTDSINLHWAAG